MIYNSSLTFALTPRYYLNMTSLFSQSPSELEELQLLFLSYVNMDFTNCTCGCKGFPINILTIEFNETEIDLEAYKNCAARKQRSGMPQYGNFKADQTYKEFLKEIYHDRYSNRAPTNKQIEKARKQAATKRYHQSRVMALNNGKATFQGKPCLKGHSGIRSVRNHECIDCRHINNLMRDAIKRGAFKEELSDSEKESIRKIYKKCRQASKETGIQYHVDHVKPLAAGGRHHPSNLQILTAAENLSKGSNYGGMKHSYKS